MVNRFLTSASHSGSKYLLCLLAMIMLWQISIGQRDQKTDSLLMVVQSMKEDTGKVSALIELSTLLRKSKNYTDAKKYGEDALVLAQKINFSKGIAMSHLMIGIIYNKQANYDDAITSYNMALNLFKENDLKKEIADTYILMGEIDFNQGNNDKALKNYLTAIKTSEEIGDKAGIAIAHNHIGAVYQNQGSYTEAINRFQASIILNEELKNKRGMATSYGQIGNTYAYQGNYTEALKNYLAFLKIYEELGDNSGASFMYNNVGYIYTMQGNYTEALKNYLAVLNIQEEIGDKKGIAVAYSNIGGIYLLHENYTEALKNYQLSLQLNKEIGNKAGIAHDHNNIGVVYQDQGKFSEAIENHQASLKIKEETGDKQGIGESYNNIAAIYEGQGKLTDALENYMASLKITEEIGDKKGTAGYSNNIGYLNIKLNRLNEAKKYLDTGLALSMEMGVKEEITHAYEGLAQVDSILGNYKEALEHYMLYIFYRDSLSNEENSKVLNEIQTKYETEKKDKEILSLESEKMISDLELKAHQEALIRIKIEKEKILTENLFNLQQLKLLEKEKRLQELDIEKNKIEIAMQKAEMDNKQGQLELLNKEGDIQKLEIKKQTLLKNSLMAGVGVFFLFGLFAYNNHITRQKLKLQTLRNKIASDLHDDVGSTLSSISIFSEMARQQSKEVIPHLETIGESSRKMLDAMADIVWTINPENDQFEKILLRMRSFAYDLLGAKQIGFEFAADDEVSKIKLPMDVRKNLYLIFKEATNNMVKYSGADKAMFSIKEEKDNLVMLIRDNGKGFDTHKSTEGNGLKNMKKRAEEIGAKLIIDSFPGSGTTIQLQIAV